MGVEFISGSLTIEWPGILTPCASTAVFASWLVLFLALPRRVVKPSDAVLGVPYPLTSLTRKGGERTRELDSMRDREPEPDVE